MSVHIPALIKVDILRKNYPEENTLPATVKRSFATEQNPFELSFERPSGSGKSSTDQSPKELNISTLHTPRTPGSNRLPPFRSIVSGSFPEELHWNNLDSLRAGPLSPSLLNGPVDTSADLPPTFVYKTSLTPQSLSPLLNDPLPPITPGTAAAIQQFIMHKPTTSAALQPSEHPDIVSSFLPLAAGRNETSSQSTSSFRTPVDNVSSAASSMMAISSRTHFQSPSSQPTTNYLDPEISQTSNGLFLLTRAHELSQQTDDMAAAATLSSLNNLNSFHMPERNSADRALTSTLRSNNTSTSLTGKRKKSESVSTKSKRIKTGEEEAEDDSTVSSEKTEKTSDNKPETEEEKRKNFLERNRQAALKCRQRKKAWLASLQAKVESLSEDNDALQATVESLREEIASLTTLLIEHRQCLRRSEQRAPQDDSAVGYQ